MSVIVCSRDRPNDLAACLDALTRVTYREFEVIVIDSASRTVATRDVVRAFADAGVVYHRVEEPGLARSRNAGARIAQHEYLAFTDDDVIVDRRWLSWLAGGFSSSAGVGCVTGMVASGQLLSPSQHYFDKRVTWASSLTAVEFSLAAPPEDVPLFPFQFGVYGTGANFAIRRETLAELRGFDNALGAGSATGAGEDTDVFIRLILSKGTILYEPNAVVWHKHRTDQAALATQLHNYGTGIGAVVVKLLADPRARRLLVPLIGRGLRHTLNMVRVGDASVRGSGTEEAPSLAGRELLGLLRGPAALYRARRRESRLESRSGCAR